MIDDSGHRGDLGLQDSHLPIPGSWIESTPNDGSESGSDSDCESENDQDSDYGDDPDYDVERLANRETSYYIRIPTPLPLTPQSSLLLFIRGGSIPFPVKAASNMGLNLLEYP
jgi:hypothetical protein